MVRCQSSFEASAAIYAESQLPIVLYIDQDFDTFVFGRLYWLNSRCSLIDPRRRMNDCLRAAFLHSIHLVWGFRDGCAIRAFFYFYDYTTNQIIFCDLRIRIDENFQLIDLFDSLAR